MRCEEDGNAEGWRAFLGNDPRDPEDEPQAYVFCPECTEREFGPSARRTAES